MPDRTVLEHFHEMPIIEMQDAFCHAHWHEYDNRREPSRNPLVMTFHLWSSLIAEPEFIKAIGCWKEPPELCDWPSDFSIMNEQMRSKPFVPWCCYLGPERREVAWLATPMRTQGHA
jgi:hypothetical protein